MCSCTFTNWRSLEGLLTVRPVKWLSVKRGSTPQTCIGSRKQAHHVHMNYATVAAAFSQALLLREHSVHPLPPARRGNNELSRFHGTLRVWGSASKTSTTTRPLLSVYRAKPKQKIIPSALSSNENFWGRNTDKNMFYGSIWRFLIDFI